MFILRCDPEDSLIFPFSLPTSFLVFIENAQIDPRKEVVGVDTDRLLQLGDCLSISPLVTVEEGQVIMEIRISGI